MDRLDQARDTTGELQNLLEFETLISDLSSRFINLPPEGGQPVKPTAAGQREVDHGDVRVEPPRRFDQRGLVGDHDDGTEHAVQQATHAFGEAVMPVSKQNAAEMLLVQDASLPG